MEARYTYRLRVSTPQGRALQEVFDSCRFVWNTSLGRWSDLWRYEQVSLGYVSMAAELTDWRGRYEWLAAVPVTPQQQVQRDLDKAIRAFYDKKHPGRRPGSRRKGLTPLRRGTSMASRSGTTGFASQSKVAVLLCGSSGPGRCLRCRSR